MSHYVIIDGVLQKSTPETSRWARRAALGVPPAESEEPTALFHVDHESEEEPDEPTN